MKFNASTHKIVFENTQKKGQREMFKNALNKMIEKHCNQKVVEVNEFATFGNAADKVWDISIQIKNLIDHNIMASIMDSIITRKEESKLFKLLEECASLNPDVATHWIFFFLDRRNANDADFRTTFLEAIKESTKVGELFKDLCEDCIEIGGWYEIIYIITKMKDCYVKKELIKHVEKQLTLEIDNIGVYSSDIDISDISYVLSSYPDFNKELDIKKYQYALMVNKLFEQAEFYKVEKPELNQNLYGIFDIRESVEVLLNKKTYLDPSKSLYDIIYKDIME